VKVKAILAIAIALSLVACAAPPTNADPYCALWVERTVTYGTQSFTQVECAVWEFGPSAAERKAWDKQHPAASHK
jgi:hypothetical protein